MKTQTATPLLTDKEVMDAYQVLKGVVDHTPLQYNDYLSKRYNCNVYLKREDLQPVRSFKIRGAYYAISKVPEDVRQKGVVCASAGNHAQGVAWTSAKMNIPAVIFMPTITPKQKVDQVKFFGGSNVQIELVGDSFDDAEAAAEKYCKDNELTFIAPFDNLDTMAGQGTLAVEIVDDLKKENKKMDYIFAAIGGGGLMSGVSTHVKATSPETTVVGVEPSGAASMAKAFNLGRPAALNELDKFVDGAAVLKAGELTYATCKANINELVQVPEGQDCITILDLYSKLAIVAEPAGALSVSALENCKDEIENKTVVCVVSGGNNDIDRMPEIEERALVFEGYQHYFIAHFAQRAGALRQFVNNVLNPDDDITKFEYTKKVNSDKGPVLVGVRLGKVSNINGLISRLEEFDPKYINLQENETLYHMLV